MVNLHMQCGMQLDCIVAMQIFHCILAFTLRVWNPVMWVLVHSFSTESEMYNDLWVQIVVAG